MWYDLENTEGEDDEAATTATTAAAATTAIATPAL